MIYTASLPLMKWIKRRATANGYTVPGWPLNGFAEQLELFADCEQCHHRAAELSKKIRVNLFVKKHRRIIKRIIAGVIR
jgi:hypothetical protein